MNPHRPPPTWTQLELEVLRALSVQVKYLTTEQIARGWCDMGNHADESSECVIESLRRSGLMEEETIEVYETPRPTQPLLEWTPGDPPPTAGQLHQLADLLATRWSQRLQAVQVFRASREAANVFGATTGEGKDRSSDWSHDLLISEVLLRYRAVHPVEVKDWIGESFVPKLGLTIKGMKDPDAFLIVAGRIERIIEIGGKYSVEHLQALHEHCAGGAYRRLREFASSQGGRPVLRLYDQQSIPYEIW
jgi:hypothetical protein